MVPEFSKEPRAVVRKAIRRAVKGKLQLLDNLLKQMKIELKRHLLLLYPFLEGTFIVSKHLNEMK